MRLIVSVYTVVGSRQLRRSVEYKFQRQEGHERAPARRNLLIVLLGLFQAVFIIIFAFFAKYEKDVSRAGPNLYPSKLVNLCLIKLRPLDKSRPFSVHGRPQHDVCGLRLPDDLLEALWIQQHLV